MLLKSPQKTLFYMEKMKKKACPVRVKAYTLGEERKGA